MGNRNERDFAISRARLDAQRDVLHAAVNLTKSKPLVGRRPHSFAGKRFANGDEQ